MPRRSSKERSCCPVTRRTSHFPVPKDWYVSPRRSGVAGAGGKGTKTAKFDAAVRRQSLGDFVKEDRDDRLDLTRVKPRIMLTNFLHQFRTDHRLVPSYRPAVPNLCFSLLKVVLLYDQASVSPIWTEPGHVSEKHAPVPGPYFCVRAFSASPRMSPSDALESDEPY